MTHQRLPLRIKREPPIVLKLKHPAAVLCLTGVNRTAPENSAPEELQKTR
ncbi:MAG: hypothetical protein KDA77_20320 [Planctomycetaceae bacterium]|nr:hypothetical protein [Planctomycetaceae bacterium]